MAETNRSRPADRLAELRIGDEQRGSRPFALITAVVGGLVLLGGGLSAVFLLGSEPEVATIRSARVRSVSVDAGTTVLNASGYVTARRQATVSSKMAGLITDISIEEGMEVAEGQVLARLDSSNLDRSLRLAEAQADAARKAVLEVEAQLAEARLRQDRTRRLVEQQVAGRPISTGWTAKWPPSRRASSGSRKTSRSRCARRM